MRLTCNRFLASSTLLSIKFAETVYTVWALIFGNESLSRQLSFTHSTHKAFFMPRLVIVSHSSRSYNLMCWQTRQNKETKVWIMKDCPILCKYFHLFSLFQYAQEKRGWSNQLFFIWIIHLTNLQLNSTCYWFVILNFLSQYNLIICNKYVIFKGIFFYYTVGKCLESGMLSEEKFSVIGSGCENWCWDNS